MKIRVLCKGDYSCYTLLSWLREISDLLSEESGESVEIVEELSTESEMPELYIGDDLVLMGVPGEEGYLIEAIKHYIKSSRFGSKS